jgi:hypothetical protein
MSNPTTTRQPARPAQLTFTRAGNGVRVRRGFNHIFLTWKSIRELEQIRRLPMVEAWLLDMLVGGPCDAAAIMKSAHARRYDPSTLRRARRELGDIMGSRKGVRYWRLPGVFE